MSGIHKIQHVVSDGEIATSPLSLLSCDLSRAGMSWRVDRLCWSSSCIPWPSSPDFSSPRASGKTLSLSAFRSCSLLGKDYSGFGEALVTGVGDIRELEVASEPYTLAQFSRPLNVSNMAAYHHGVLTTSLELENSNCCPVWEKKSPSTSETILAWISSIAICLLRPGQQEEVLCRH